MSEMIAIDWSHTKDLTTYDGKKVRTETLRTLISRLSKDGLCTRTPTCTKSRPPAQKVRQWLFCACLRFEVALVAYKKAILLLVSRIGDSLNSPPSILNFFMLHADVNGLALASATDGRSIVKLAFLSQVSFCSAMPIEVSHNPPPSGWYCDKQGDWQYWQNDRWTGIIIFPFRNLWLRDRLEAIPLKHSYYRISFNPNCDIDKGYDVIESPTLNRAKKLAEWYYEKWLKIHNE